MRKEDIYGIENEIVETTVENGKLKVKNLHEHSKRATKFKRLDRVTPEELNVALEYFDYRCAYSGERFVTFEEKVSNKNTTLSIDHIVALVSGGHNIAQNMVPAIFQYNNLKNGYHLIDWWKKQQNLNSEYIYNPYRMLKLFNYMSKSLQAMELKGEEYREAILTPNEIDRYLSEHQRQLYSNNLMAQKIDNDGVDILQKVPPIEYDIAELDEEKRERYSAVELSEFMNNMLMELEDSEIDRDILIASRSIYNNLANREKVFERIPEEEKIQAKIIEYFKELDCKNVYTIARVIDIPSLLKNSVNVKKYLDEKVQTVRLFLDERKIDKAILPQVIDNVPDILINEDKSYQWASVSIEIPENMRELERLGIDAREKDPQNINTVLQIVEGYNFEQAIGREIDNNEKKAIIELLIANKKLNKGRSVYISNLLNNLVEKGLSEQEVYGAVINYAIGENNTGYYDVLDSKNKIGEKAEIVTEITEESINLALFQNGMEVPRDMEKLKNLGIEVNEKDPRNIHTAIEIVEGYNFKETIGRELDDNEKKAIIQLLLGPKSLERGKGCTYISTLFNNLLAKNLTRQEIYGAIINYAIGEGNKGYSTVLVNKNNIGEEDILIEITEESISLALLKNGVEISQDIEKIKKLGIEVNEKDPRNIHTAIEIVEGYNFKETIGRELDDNEKKAIIQSLLGQKILNKGESTYISTLLKNLSEKGLSEQEAYGAVMNYAIGDGNIGYQRVIDNKNKIGKKEEIVTNITEESIKKAISKMEKTNLKLFQHDLDESKDIKKLKELGIKGSGKNPRNIHTAIEIVEGYNFKEAIGREIDKNERKAIMELLLGQKILNNEKSIYISSLISNLIEKGLSQQDAYGAVINYAIGDGNKGYGSVLGNKNNIGKKEEIITQITEERVQFVVVNLQKHRENLKNNNGIIKNIEEIEKLQIDIAEKDPRNVDIAIEIVEGYNFKETIGRALDDNEKKAIIQLLLGQKILNKGESTYISTLLKNLSEKGLSEQEAYGAVMNYAIGEGKKSYGSVLAGKKNIGEKGDIVIEITEESINLALLQKGEEVPKDIEKLKELAIDANEKDSRNIHTAIEIVEGYNFEEAIGREINNNEKKVIIQFLLANKKLNKGRSVYISNLLNNLLERGLTKEEAYGAIVNYAIGDGNIKYSDVLDSKNKIGEKAEIVTEITEESINLALLQKGEEVPKDMEKLKELGIEVNEKDPRNIHTAIEIVERYSFKEAIGRELDDNEKKAIIQLLLGPKSLERGKGCTYISTLFNNLLAKNLTRQEIYGAIINYAIGEGNKAYSAVLVNKNNIEEDIVIKITQEGIDQALFQNGMEIPEDIEKLKKLGIESNEKDSRNMHIALKIVEEYKFEEAIGRGINDSEKKAIIELLVRPKELNKDNSRYISILLNNLLEKGLSKEEAYGAVINYAVGKGNKNYKAVLTSKNNIGKKEEIVTEITEESIKKVVAKSEKKAKAVAKQCVTKERVAKNDKVLGLLNDLGKENTRETLVDR